MLSHPLLFSLCWPLAKEHTRRNRQSRTFLVENVIGEIWSELEEGSVLECPLPLLDFVGVCVCVRVCVCWQKCIPICSFYTFGNVPNRFYRPACPGRALFGAVILHVLKPYRLFRTKIGAGTHQFQGKPCVINSRSFDGAVTLAGSCQLVHARYAVSCDMNALVVKIHSYVFTVHA